MDALDNLTLRKRRDLLFNRAEAPYAYLRQALFQFNAHAPFVAPQMHNPAAPPQMNNAAANLTGAKRELPEPQLGDDVQPFERPRQVGPEPFVFPFPRQAGPEPFVFTSRPAGAQRAPGRKAPAVPDAASVTTRAQKKREAEIALEAQRGGRPDVAELERTRQRQRQQPTGEMDVIHMDMVHPRPSGDTGRTNERRQTRRRGENL